MIRVAKHLQNFADSAKLADDVNFFGRSAFNRFYYVIFLDVRAILNARDPKWGRVSHSSVPAILRSAVLSDIKKVANLQLKRGLLSLGEFGSLSDKASLATNELADILEEAYAVRCNADYDPEYIAIKENGAIVLRGKKLSAAAAWPRRAKFRLGEISRVWRDLGFQV